MSPLPISLCMIVKNEEQLLSQCLHDARRWVHEVVVVDTGSSDRTPAIARRLGARVLSKKFTTEDEVRNAYIAEARAPWLLVLDADERIAATDLPRLERLVQKRGIAGWGFALRDYTDDWNLLCDWRPNAGEYPEEEAFAETCGYAQMHVTRLVRRDAIVGYSGIWHAQLQFRPGAAARLREAPFPLHHFACRKRVTGRKQLRSVQLLLKEERAGKLRPGMLQRIAVGFFLRGDDARAWQYAQRALEVTPTDRGSYQVAGLVALTRGDEATAIRVLRLGLRRHVDATDLRYILALAHFRRGEVRQARRALETVLLAAPWHPLAWNALGLIEREGGDMVGARRAFETALQWHPKFRAARSNLRSLDRAGPRPMLKGSRA